MILMIFILLCIKYFTDISGFYLLVLHSIGLALNHTTTKPYLHKFRVKNLWCLCIHQGVASILGTVACWIAPPISSQLDVLSPPGHEEVSLAPLRMEGTRQETCRLLKVCELKQAMFACTKTFNNPVGELAVKKKKKEKKKRQLQPGPGSQEAACRKRDGNASGTCSHRSSDSGTCSTFLLLHSAGFAARPAYAKQFQGFVSNTISFLSVNGLTVSRSSARVCLHSTS